MNSEMYKSKRWEKKRQRILRRDKYKCQHYKRYGKNVEAVIVHHIYPVEEFPEFAWRDWNLISLSVKAHNKMHDRNTNKLTKEGLKLMQRTKIPNIPPS